MPKVRVFSTPTCAYCTTLKEYLKDNKIEFEDVNVADNAEAREEMVQKSKQISVPVVEIDDQVIIGFDKKAICKLLNIRT